MGKLDMDIIARKPMVLVADDDSTNVNLLKNFLGAEYEIRTSTCGRRALDIAITEPCLDLILLDIHMPDMDGFEVCRKLKQNPVTRNIPVILLTADHDETNEKLGLELGVADYLSKPFSVAITKTRIHNHLRLKQEIARSNMALEALQMAGLIYHHISDGMIITDSDSNIVAINSVFTETTGYTLEEVFGRNPKLLSSGRQDKSFYQEMWNTLQTTGSWQGDLTNRRKNGEEYAESLRIHAISHADGSVRHYVGLFLDITQKKQTEEQMWRLANYDSLTGLFNRRMFREYLSAKLKKAYRTGNSLALVFVDIDEFKEINDNFGLTRGDALLQAIAQRLKHQIRETDILARLGGDEFSIIFDELDGSLDIGAITQSIIDLLAQPFELMNEMVYVSVSIGISIYPVDAANIDDLINNAEQAMYIAKQQGGVYRFFKPEMQEKAQKKRLLISDLKVALLRNQFEIYYQPIMALTTNSIVKVEALVRWQHPSQGLISPAKFVPSAEEAGLIHDIGNWVFYEAVQQLAHWRSQCKIDLQISINKSPAQFMADRIDHKDWFDYLHKLGLPGHSIVIEITEGLLLDANNKITDQLLAFRDAGIQVAIDDFGTGYSAMSYLKKFDIDYLKIDQSFTRGLAPYSADHALCEAIVTMAHKLDLQVIAEGVETQAQNDLLTAMGCDFGQGYLYARPMPASDFANLLACEIQK